jgi:ribonuclease HI
LVEVKVVPTGLEVAGLLVVHVAISEVVVVVLSPLTKPTKPRIKNEGLCQPNPIVNPPEINFLPKSIVHLPPLSGVVNITSLHTNLLSQHKHLKKMRPVETITTLHTPATPTHTKNQKLKSKDLVEIRPGVGGQRSYPLTPHPKGVSCHLLQAMSSNLQPQIIRQTEQSHQTSSGQGWITLPTEGLHTDGLGLTLGQPLPVGGRLTHFLLQWQSLIQDRFAKSIVKNGYQIDWIHNPPHLSTRVIYTHLNQQSQLLQAEVAQMLQKGAIEQVHLIDPGFWSTFFLVPKKDSDQMRPVINLKSLNKFIKCPTFKMHSPQSVLRFIHKGNWLASIDLKDAYFHVPIHQTHYRFLRFAFQGKTYQFRVLPFGLSTAPRVFTKVLAPVVGYLHQQGVHLYPYLDDCLLVAKNPQTLYQTVGFTINVLQKLGFLINFNKSHLQPTQRITFLGMEIDTQVSAVFLPRQKAEKIIKIASLFLPVGIYMKARHYLKFLGLMASTLMMVPRARLYMRPLQVYLNSMWDRRTMSLDFQIVTPFKLVKTIQWWSNLDNLLTGLEFPPKKHSVIVTTDASKMAWGAHCESQTVQGSWNPHQQTLHINLLELMAVWNALKAFLHLVKNHVVLIQTDNTSVLHYINNSGGTKSVLLCKTTWEMLHWCLSNNIELRATHIPGKDNILADRLSRHIVSHLEWELHPQVANQLFLLWHTPTIDLFASFQNSKLDSPMP